MLWIAHRSDGHSSRCSTLRISADFAFHRHPVKVNRNSKQIGPSLMPNERASTKFGAAVPEERRCALTGAQTAAPTFKANTNRYHHFACSSESFLQKPKSASIIAFDFPGSVRSAEFRAPGAIQFAHFHGYKALDISGELAQNIWASPPPSRCARPGVGSTPIGRFLNAYRCGVWMWYIVAAGAERSASFTIRCPDPCASAGEGQRLAATSQEAIHCCGAPNSPSNRVTQPATLLPESSTRIRLTPPFWQHRLRRTSTATGTSRFPIPMVAD